MEIAYGNAIGQSIAYQPHDSWKSDKQATAPMKTSEYRNTSRPSLRYSLEGEVEMGKSGYIPYYSPG